MKPNLTAGIALIITALPSAPVAASETNSGPAATISCPAKSKSSRVIDLSTGGSAPWVVEGPDIPNGKARATPLDPSQIPAGWAVRMEDAGWVQALPQNDLVPHAPGGYIFSLSFTVKKGKRMPRLALTGQVTADEAFDLNLIEPAPENQHVSSGIAYGDDTPGEVEPGDAQPLDLTLSGDQSGKPLGHRAGIYHLQIAVENGAEANAALGLLARLKLGVLCGGAK